MLVEILLLAAVPLLLLWLKLTKSKVELIYNKFPGPKQCPLVGNILEFYFPRREISERLKALSYEYGPVYLLRLGAEYFVCLRDPADIEVIFSNSKIIDKPPLYKMIHPWVGQGLFTSQGDRWIKQRKVLTPAFGFKILETFVPIFSKHANVLVTNLHKMVGLDFDVMPLIAPCALDIIGETAMGLNMNTQVKRSQVFDAVEELSLIIAQRLTSILQRSFLFPLLQSGRRHDQLISYLHGVTDKIIKERKEKFAVSQNNSDTSTKGKKVFLDLLLEYNTQGAGMSDAEIRMQVDTFLVAGYDTSQVSMSFCLYCLSQNPEIQERVYEELHDIFGDSERDASYHDLFEMKHLDKVIRETLRLYPPARYVSRVASEDLVLKSGYTIPKGTSIMVLLEALAHDPKIFPEPLKFDPDRFDGEVSHPFAYIPFGAGIRNCIAQKYAMLEMKAVLSRVLRSFTLLPTDVPVVPRFQLFLRSSTGVRLRLKPRTNTTTLLQ